MEERAPPLHIVLHEQVCQQGEGLATHKLMAVPVNKRDNSSMDHVAGAGHTLFTSVHIKLAAGSRHHVLLVMLSFARSVSQQSDTGVRFLGSPERVLAVCRQFWWTYLGPT